MIAVVDSGIDLTHPDLSPNQWINPGEIAGNGLDDDNSGYIDDVNGWNFVDNNNDVSDNNGHGTLVAGIAAARTNNALGIAAVCGQCRIMPVKVMQSTGVANYSDIAAGITYAVAKGARVIKLSLGGYTDSRTLRDAVANAIAQNDVVVGGAGNDGIGTPFFPASYPNVIAAAGTTETDTRASFSNYGSWITVSAPGQDILTIDTVDPSGRSGALSTQVVDNGDGTFTATAQTSHLSPFVLFAPGVGTPVPLAYLPVVLSNFSGTSSW